MCFSLAAHRLPQTFDNIRITRNAWDSPLSSVNPKFIAVALEAQGGGQFQVIPIEQVALLLHAYPTHHIHSTAVWTRTTPRLAATRRPCWTCSGTRSTTT